MSHKIKPRSRIDQSRVWVYFKQSDGDPDKARCNLCSIELCHRGSIDALWNHVKSKHSIDRSNLSQDDDTIRDTYPVAKLATTNTANNHNHIKQSNNRNSSKIPSLQNNHHHHNNHQHRHHNQQNQNQSTSNLILDYSDLSMDATSMKPSLSKNIINRLNELSSPVTRKLKFWNKKSFQVNQYDPSFKVIYLGNLGVQLWSKDESCLDKPLSTLWNNYLVNMKTEIVMRLTICNSGLKAITRQHGLTQYWSNRLVYCCSHKNYPRIFSWVYRHEGKKMRQELRCHAVFCPTPEKASKMVTLLNERLSCALQEFRREKKCRSSSTITTTSKNESPFHQNLQRTVPLRRQILAKGTANFRPPLERSKSAPKLTSIIEEEDYETSSEEGDVVDTQQQLHDVFEYEESFGEKDDDEEEVEGHDGDSANKIESNSLTRTVDEETSNSSSAYATGDRSYEKGKSSNHSEESFDHLQSNSKPTLMTNNHCISIADDRTTARQDSNLAHTKELYQDSSSNAMNHENNHHQDSNHHHHHHHQQQDHNLSHMKNQKTSANTRISSSLLANHLSTSQQQPPSLSTKELNRTEAAAVNHENDDDSDDKPTKEIILSWSNLVIE